MAVLYGIHVLIPQKPDLIVSGINYGLNVGSGVTISGTVGAALEGASADIPALAISLETDRKYHSSYSREVDFRTAGHFTTFFSQQLLSKKMPPDVHLLKVEIPAGATQDTPWHTTRLSMLRFYEPVPPEKNPDSNEEGIGYDIAPDFDQSPPGTDSHSVVNKKEISVTPLSLDLTSRIDLSELEKFLRQD